MQAGSYCAQPDLHTGRYGRDVDGTISAPHSFGKSDLEYGSGAPRSGCRRFLGEGGEGRQAAAESGFEDGGAQGSPWALIPCGADDDTDEDGAQDIGGQGHPWEGGQGGKGGGK